MQPTPVLIYEAFFTPVGDYRRKGPLECTFVELRHCFVFIARVYLREGQGLCRCQDASLDATRTPLYHPPLCLMPIKPVPIIELDAHTYIGQEDFLEHEWNRP